MRSNVFYTLFVAIYYPICLLLYYEWNFDCFCFVEKKKELQSVRMDYKNLLPQAIDMESNNKY